MKTPSLWRGGASAPLQAQPRPLRHPRPSWPLSMQDAQASSYIFLKHQYNSLHQESNALHEIVGLAPNVHGLAHGLGKLVPFLLKCRERLCKGTDDLIRLPQTHQSIHRFTRAKGKTFLKLPSVRVWMGATRSSASTNPSAVLIAAPSIT